MRTLRAGLVAASCQLAVVLAATLVVWLFELHKLMGQETRIIPNEEPVSAQAQKEIRALVRNYRKPGDYFIEKLSEGVGMIGAAFYPKPVIVRLSDFKTNEYARLLSAEGFEPKEENPMLGFRGAVEAVILRNSL